MQSCESRGCKPLSPYSVHRHLLLLHPGIPATGSLGFGLVTTEMKMHDRKQWLCLEASACHTWIDCFPRLGSVLSDTGLVDEGVDAFYSY